MNPNSYDFKIIIYTQDNLSLEKKYNFF